MLLNYFKIAWRRILKNKAYVFISVAGLSIGLCACIIIFLVAKHEMAFDHFHKDGGLIYRVGGSVTENNGTGTPSPVFSNLIPPAAPEALQKEIPGISEVAGYYPYFGSVAIKENEKKFSPPATIEAIITTPAYFKIFDYEWLAGSSVTSLAEPSSIVLSDSKMRKYFGSVTPEQVIGRHIIYNDSLLLSVTGVVKDWKGNTDFPFSEFISYSTIRTTFLKNAYSETNWDFAPGKSWISAFVKLAPSAKPSIMEKQLAAFAAHWKSDQFLQTLQFRLHFQPISDIHSNNSYTGDGIRKVQLTTLYALIAVAIFILIIAAVNFINLSTAQALQRSKEIGVRKVLGSGVNNLLFQLLFETFITTALAVALAVALVKFFVPALRDYLPPNLEFHITEPVNLVFILLITFITALLAGIYPARLLSSYSPAQSFQKQATEKSGKHRTIRKGLIVFQLSVSVIFIICAIVIRQQLAFMLHSDLGLKADSIVTLTNWNGSEDQMKALQQKIGQIPGIQQAILQGAPPIGSASIEMPIQFGTQKEMMIAVQSGTTEFFPFYSMRLLAGKNLRGHEFLINETYARALGFSKPTDAVGQLLRKNKETYTIAGVLADFHQSSLRDPIRPLLIGNLPAIQKTVGIKFQKGDIPLSMIARVEQAWKDVYPNDPFVYAFLDDSVTKMYNADQQTFRLVSSAMVVAIFISCIGLLGLIMFTTRRRAREISIRKLLGARPGALFILLTREFLLYIVLSFLIAAPVAIYLANSWLQNFAFRVSISGSVFLLAAVGMFFIVGGTVSFHVLKAALVNPAKGLKSE